MYYINLLIMIKKNTRVRDKDRFLGKGTTKKIDKEFNDMVLVKWDKNPPDDYNLGKNPCWINNEDLIKLKKKKKWKKRN